MMTLLGEKCVEPTIFSFTRRKFFRADRVVAEHDSRRKKPLSCRGDSDFCAHLPRGVKIFALPTNSVACISYV